MYESIKAISNIKVFFEIAIIVLSISLIGCASNSGVVQIGPDTFMISRQASTGFSGLGSLKADAFREAGKYCSSQNKLIQVTNTTESQGPYVLGNYPRAEIQFMCLSPGDSDLARPKMQKAPDTVIEIKK